MDEPPSTARMLLIVAAVILGFSAETVGGSVVAAEQYSYSDDQTIMAAADPGVDFEPVDLTAQFDTVQHVLLAVCTERGYGEDCARTLLGMLWKESLGDGQAIGDAGKARGWFQIHYRLHKIDISCAEDLRCSADWTIDYLESNGYPRYVAYAVQCHNGCNIANGYAASAMRHGNRLWSTPLFLNDDALAIR